LEQFAEGGNNKNIVMGNNNLNIKCLNDHGGRVFENVIIISNIMIKFLATRKRRLNKS
jgi:hypothetical protein